MATAILFDINVNYKDAILLTEKDIALMMGVLSRAKIATQNEDDDNYVVTDKKISYSFRNEVVDEPVTTDKPEEPNSVL